MKRKREYKVYINSLFCTVVSLFLFASCTNGYRIEGSSSVLRLDGKMLFIKVPKGNKMVKIDSAEVVHGMFVMEGSLDSVVIASLYMDDESIMPLVVENGDIEIRIDNANITVNGTPLNDKLYAFVKEKAILDDRSYELERMESRMIMDGMSLDEVTSEVNKVREKIAKDMDELTKSFIQDNYNNVLGPGVFIMLCNSFPYPILTPWVEDIVEAAPEVFKNDVMIKTYMEAAEENMDRLQTSM